MQTADATLLFSPARAESISPGGGREGGGTRVTIAGAGLGSVLRVPEVALTLALDSARSVGEAEAAYAAFAPVRHPVTGLLPVAGVAVRFTLRTDDVTAGVAPGAALGAGAPPGAPATTDDAFPVVTVPAYYPAGFECVSAACAFARASRAHAHLHTTHTPPLLPPSPLCSLSSFEAAAARVAAMGGAAPSTGVSAVSPRPSSRSSRAGSAGAGSRPRAPSANSGCACAPAPCARARARPPALPN